MGLSSAYHNHIENSVPRECKKQYFNAQTDVLFPNLDISMAEAFNDSMQSDKPRLKDLFKQLPDSDRDLLVLFTQQEPIQPYRPSVDAEIRAHSVYVGAPKSTEKSILYKSTGVKGENAIALGSKEDE